MHILKYIIVLLLSLTLWGCGKANSSAPGTLDPSTKKHAAGWAVNGTGGSHPEAYFANPDSCAECHGLELNGGISGVSCSNPGRSGVACHATFPHITGFADFANHGVSAKAAVGALTGMSHCQKCHGTDYVGKGTAPSCIACHKLTNPTSNAPHAGKWAAYLGNANGLNHSTVDESNAPACAQCHTGKENLSAGGLALVAGFTTPGTGGCFNNTLCHNQAGHSFKVATHQASARGNLSSCQSCHAIPSTGSNPRFNNPKGTNAVLSGSGCENCHNKPGLAHPYMWLPGRNGIAPDVASHAKAQNINSSCGLCHGGTALTGTTVNSIIYPSCFSVGGAVIGATKCHFTKPVDGAGLTVGCVSCHASGSVNNPAGAVSAQVHNKHLKPGVSCETCHLHAGDGSKGAAHASSPATPSTPLVEILASQNAVGGTATYDVGNTCSNVSCHGGSSFFAWDSGVAVLDVANSVSCLNCHTSGTVAGSPQANSYYSGKPLPSTVDATLHEAHNGGSRLAGPNCVWCHDTSVSGTLSASHFSNLKTSVMEGPASATIGGGGTSIQTYSVTTGACFTRNMPGAPACHVLNADNFADITNAGNRKWK